MDAGPGAELWPERAGNWWLQVELMLLDFMLDYFVIKALIVLNRPQKELLYAAHSKDSVEC